MKSLYLIPFTLFALAACQGQEPFKHSSDPLHNFQDLRKESVDRTSIDHKENPAAPDNSQFACYEGFKLQVEHDAGSNLVYFTEGVQDAVTIDVESLLDNGKAWDVKPFNGKLPAGADFKQMNKQGSKATYVLTWTPPKGTSTDVVNQTLTLQYTSDADRLCGTQTHQLQRVNLVVKKNDGQPYIKTSQITELLYGKTLAIDVTIVDPNGSADLPPALVKSFDSDAANNGEHARVLNATQALDCPEAKREFKDNWVYHCTFDARQIADSELQTVLSKGEINEGEVWVSAKSPRSHLSTTTTPISVRIQFPAPTTKPAASTTDFSAPATSDDSKTTSDTKTPDTKPTTATTKAKTPKKTGQGA